MSVVIDHVEYATKSALIRRCQSYWKLLPDIDDEPKSVPNEQLQFWAEVLAYNCRVFEKVDWLTGSDVVIGYRQTPEKSYCVEAQIGLLDEYKNFVPISWHSAITEAFSPGKSHSRESLLSDIKWGLRRAIADQIKEFRSSQIHDGKITCAETGVRYAPKDIHIDHHPISFDSMAIDFLDIIEAEGVQLSYDVIHRTGINDPWHCRFKDVGIDEAWRIWHREQALLRAVHMRVNLTKPK